MHSGSILLQRFHFIAGHCFEKSAANLSGNRYCRDFTTRHQFLTCLYAQITGKDSLPEIENGQIAGHDRSSLIGMIRRFRENISCPQPYGRKGVNYFTPISRK